MIDKKDHKSLEDLLTHYYPDNVVTENTIIQDVTIPLDGTNGLKTMNNMQFAEGNAQIRDFFNMVGKACLSAMEHLDILFIPYEYAVLWKKNADQRLYKNLVTYKVIDRRHSEDSGYKPKQSGTMLDPDTNRTVIRYTERFDSVVQFSFMSMDYDTAYDMMEMFEEIMVNYSGIIKQAGIVDYYFVNENNEIIEADFREVMIVKTINYKVKTEKNRVITSENIKQAHVLGTAIVEKTKKTN